MLTVIIAEKSDAHRKYIQELVNWGRLGFEVIGQYEDGAAAMEAIFRHWPDLVLTNADLPGLSGIELIEHAQEHGLSGDFIIVEDTGDFEIARRAMRLGVQEYLIKPVEADELTQVLHKHAERRRALNGQDINERFLQTRRLLRNSFMESFASLSVPEELSVEALNQRYCFKLREGVFQCAVVVVNGLPSEEEAVFLPAVVESARARFDPICYEMIPHIQGPGRLALIFNYDGDGPTGERLAELQDIVRAHLRIRGCDGAAFSIGFGLPERDLRHLKRAQETAERAMRCGMLREQNKQYFYGSLKFDKLTSVDILTPTLVSELKSSAEMLSAEGFEKVVRNAFSPVSQRTDPAVIMDICWAAVEAVAQVCKDSDGNDISVRTRKEILDSMGSFASMQGVISGVVDWARRIFERCLKEREYTRPVRDAQNYIQKHCTQPLTLERVAEYVHLNASYFSTVFKKETGKNFSEYLMSCRIAEAKRLLRESGLSIAQICSAVGYTDNKHFSRIFTKVVGIKPSIYRSLHG